MISMENEHDNIINSGGEIGFRLGDVVWIVTVLTNDGLSMFIDECYVTCVPEIHDPNLVTVTKCVVTAISIHASPLPEIVISLTKQPDEGVDIPWKGSCSDKTWKVSIAPVSLRGLDVSEAYARFNASFEAQRLVNLKRIYWSKEGADAARDTILGKKIPISSLANLPKDLLQKIAADPSILDISK